MFKNFMQILLFLKTTSFCGLFWNKNSLYELVLIKKCPFNCGEIGRFCSRIDVCGNVQTFFFQVFGINLV